MTQNAKIRARRRAKRIARWAVQKFPPIKPKTYDKR